MFAGGWVSMIGWLCAWGVGYQLALVPVGGWLCRLAHWPAPGDLDASTLMALVVMLIGHGALHVANNAVTARRPGDGKDNGPTGLGQGDNQG